MYKIEWIGFLQLTNVYPIPVTYHTLAHVVPKQMFTILAVLLIMYIPVWTMCSKIVQFIVF